MKYNHIKIILLMNTNRKGFTLAELLIVVAIIGVLVAISIPIFSGQLDKAKIATDQANVRSAKAAAVAEFLTSGDGSEQKYFYNASTGTVQTDASNPSIRGYGKYSKDDKSEVIGAEGTPCKDGNAAYLTLIVTSDGTVSASWGNAYGSRWRNVAQGTSSTDNSKDEGHWVWTSNDVVYNEIISIPNEKREQADKDALVFFANYFLGKDASEVQSILGNKYNNATRGGDTLFAYGIDNTSHSIRIDLPSQDTSYLTELGYTGKRADGKDLDTGAKQYMTNYIFTSDEIVKNLGSTNHVKVKLKMENGKVVKSEIWIQGLQDQGYSSVAE